jgi:hypothetical protein
MAGLICHMDQKIERMSAQHGGVMEAVTEFRQTLAELPTVVTKTQRARNDHLAHTLQTD